MSNFLVQPVFFFEKLKATGPPFVSVVKNDGRFDFRPLGRSPGRNITRTIYGTDFVFGPEVALPPLK